MHDFVPHSLTQELYRSLLHIYTPSDPAKDNSVTMITHTKRRHAASSLAFTASFLAASLLATTAWAGDAKPDSWASSITFGAQFQAGFTANPARPKLNFGQLFNDKPNTLLLNQALFTIARATDPKATGWDVGFKLQLMGGSDARYTHFLGEFDRGITGRYQADIVEANVTVHAPLLTAGGVDLKFGQYATPVGYETIDPSTNPFYSHSYIFNFGIPLKHTGALAILRATPEIDLYFGVDTGVNTTFGKGENNGALGYIGGFGLTLLDGKLTVLALSHIGPENPKRLVPNADRRLRYLNDIAITYKPTDTVTFVTEFNYIRDDFAKADAGGVAQYVLYALSDTVSLNARAEVWADPKNFFVAAFPDNLDFVNVQLGRPATVVAAPKGTTYGALTLGVTYKPEMPAPLAGLMIRPEIRYDSALNGTKAFNSGKDRGALTIASDIVLSF